MQQKMKVNMTTLFTIIGGIVILTPILITFICIVALHDLDDPNLDITPAVGAAIGYFFCSLFVYRGLYPAYAPRWRLWRTRHLSLAVALQRYGLASLLWDRPPAPSSSSMRVLPSG